MSHGEFVQGMNLSLDAEISLQQDLRLSQAEERVLKQICICDGQSLADTAFPEDSVQACC